MPLYEYKCNSCGETFEVMQRFSDEPLTLHDNCGGSLEKLISASALQFKGSGWYITDYAKSGSGNPAAKSPENAKSEKTESKPAPSKSDAGSGSGSGSNGSKS